MTRILAIGDIMGKAGRNCLAHFLPRAKDELRPDIILVNGENAAGGYGMTRKIYDQFVTQFGISCVTMGNHWHEKREIYDFVGTVPNVVLPANASNVPTEDHGLKILTTPAGKSYAVVNLIGKTFMHQDNKSPFEAAERLVSKIPDLVKIRIVDMHAEATSEKQGMGQFLNGRVSLVYGTHSHVPTADERILSQGTGFLTDVGMTGAYDSVIGIRKDAALRRLIKGEKKNFEPAGGDPWLCGLLADVDDETGRCVRVERICWKSQGVEQSAGED